MTPAALGPDATPREVRARFEQLLGQHALLAVRQARSEVAMAPDLKTVGRQLAGGQRRAPSTSWSG